MATTVLGLGGYKTNGYYISDGTRQLFWFKPSDRTEGLFNYTFLDGIMIKDAARPDVIKAIKKVERKLMKEYSLRVSGYGAYDDFRIFDYLRGTRKEMCNV